MKVSDIESAFISKIFVFFEGAEACSVRFLHLERLGREILLPELDGAGYIKKYMYTHLCYVTRHHFLVPDKCHEGMFYIFDEIYASFASPHFYSAISVGSGPANCIPITLFKNREKL